MCRSKLILLSTLVALGGIPSCRCDQRTWHEKKHDDGAATHTRVRAVAEGVLKITFSEASDSRLGCQLHVITKKGRRYLAVDLGDTRRRTYFRKAKSYWVRPSRFAYTGPQPAHTLELHTSLGPIFSVRAGARRNAIAKRVLLRRALGDRVSFSCVLRKAGGPGQRVDGLIVAGSPRLMGNRPASEAELRPEAMRRLLAALLR